MRLQNLLKKIAFVVGLAGASVLPATAQDARINIMTGSPTGTYIQFGRDMQNLMGQCGKRMDVVESAGSLENFLGVRQRPNTQFGIVQNDVLEYMQTFAGQDPAIARTIQGVRIAFPLYEEEVHILAKNDITDFRGLDGRRVAIGVENSGTFLTASLMLSLAGLEPAEKLMIGQDEALSQLKAGTIDAFFYVAGAPAAIYSNGEIDGAQFHLLPIADETLRSVYSPTTLAANTYPFQAEPVDLVAVRAVLMTYEFEQQRNAYHRDACTAVADLSHLILTRLDDLKAEGHPKWKDVDLGSIPPGWDIGACVNRGISADYQPQCTAPLEATPAPAPAAATPQSESDANAVYRRSICDAMGC